MYVPLTETFPASLYWGINATSATNGNLTFFPNSTAGIVDSGTSGMLCFYSCVIPDLMHHVY